MAYKVVYSKDAYEDVNAGIEWYNEKRPSLGFRFYEAVEEQEFRIRKKPFGFAVRYKDVRCAIVKHFPYMIHYMVNFEKKEIKIIAVMSMSRNPDLWEKRIGL